MRRHGGDRSFNEILYFTKVIGFYPRDFRWGGYPIRSMFEKRSLHQPCEGQM
jgi:hypothetical protein